MSPLQNHPKASSEVPTTTEASSFTSKDADVATIQAESQSTHTNPSKSSPLGAGPAPQMVGHGPVHDQKNSKEKHHFWQHTRHPDDDRAQQVEYLKSRGFDEEHAKQAAENVEKERHNSGQRKSLADKVLGSLPTDNDPLSKGNLGQGLVWR